MPGGISVNLRIQLYGLDFKKSSTLVAAEILKN